MIQQTGAVSILEIDCFLQRKLSSGWDRRQSWANSAKSGSDMDKRIKVSVPVSTLEMVWSTVL
jgi:hypothetical protein